MSLRNFLTYLFVPLIGVAMIGLLTFDFAQSQKAHASIQLINCTDLTRTSTFGNGTTTTNGCVNNGTSTPVYFTNSAATTTMMVNTGNTSQLTLNLDVVASSTSSVVTWRMQYSFNGQDWYDEDVASTTATNNIHSGAAALETWTPGTTVETRRSMNIQVHPSKFTRFGFQVTGANASLYAQTILQNVAGN